MDMDRTQELEEQVRRLSQSVDEMRAEIAGIHGGKDNQPKGSSSSRRGFLRLGIAAAAGALGWAAVKAVPAAAATGGPMLLGSTNVAENATTLQADAAITGGEVLGVESQNFSQANLTTALSTFTETFAAPLRALGDSAGTVEGFDAWADGPSAYAIWGLTDHGTGITGEAIHGIGVYSRGTGRIRQDPQNLPGPPSYAPNLMEQIRDANGVLWIHNASATLTDWRRVNTLRTDKSDGSGAPFKPVRIADTRSGIGGFTGPIANAQVKSFNVITLSGGTIPADAIAVTGNLTATGWNLNGFLTIFPGGTLYNPNADPSSMNFSGTAYAWANSFVVGLGTGGSAGQVSVYTGTFGSGHTNFIIDITGYIQ
jgi:hypothetical protein